MDFPEVESSLSEATKIFDSTVLRREKLIKDSRDVISLCAKTIVNVHSSNFREAVKLKKEAKTRLEKLRQIAGSDLVKYLNAPEQEFVESSVVYSLVIKSSIPSLSDLKVSPSAYVLGMLDSIGELKRLVYDKIRKGGLSEAERLFSAMESLYILASPLAVYDNITAGVKRKLDIARMLIEDSRAIVTEEARRLEFMKAVNSLAERLGSHPILQKKTPRSEIKEPKGSVIGIEQNSDENMQPE